MNAGGDRTGRTATQIPLDLQHRPAMGREDFLVADSNRAAVEIIDRWPDWQGAAVFLAGPEGSGKSHLSQVWRTRSKARQASASDVSVESVPGLLENGALFIEDVSDADLDEKAMFHLLNFVREQACHVLITSRSRPAHWHIGLPDLRSRLRAAPVAVLEEPDDALLKAVLAKLFRDRQLDAAENVLNFLVVRMERSLAAAGALVDSIDRAALAGKAPVTRALVSSVLSEIAGAEEREE